MFLACWLSPAQSTVAPVSETVSNADAAAILTRVAQLQQQALDARSRWVFDQQVLVRLFRGKGKLAREELREYHVQPQPDRTERELVRFSGKVEIDGVEYPYADPKYRAGEIDLDGEIAESLSEDFGNGKNGRDGVEDDSLYPLSERMMARHQFQLHGVESYRGREVYRFTFEPKRKGKGEERGSWKGEMLVDRQSFAPVLVVTQQARGVPIAIRTLLGSNVKQVGFKLEYTQVEDGVWFPSHYSGEFSLRVLFGYGRTIALSVRNSSFQRASAETEIHYDLPAEETEISAP